MEKYISILGHTKLFWGIDDAEIEAMTRCLGMRACEYQKGEYVYRSGESVHSAALLVSGSLIIQKDDYWGNRSIVSHIAAGEMFGESYAMQNSEAIANDVIACEDSVAVLFEVQRLLTTCSNACRFHMRVIENLLQSISAKNRILTQKIDHMSKRSTREKLVSYLSAQSKIAGSASFDIPFNRQQLADYLAVDRSAMSNELCKMRDAGMLTFQKNHFSLIAEKH